MRLNVVVIFGILLLFKAAAWAVGAEGAEGQHEGVPVQVLYQAINFSILVGLLYFVTRKKVAEHLIGRGEAHAAAKVQAKKAIDEAEERHKDLTSKLENLHRTEEQEIRRAQNEAMELKSKLIQDAEALAKRMVDDARKTTTFEHEKAKQGLREEALDLALKQAREAIQKNVTKDDQKNMQKQFIDSIGAAQ